MRQLTIPITDHNSEGVCTENYIVQYKIIGDTSWAFTGTFYTSPIIINGFLDDTEYTIRVQRTCCGGVLSDPMEFNFDTEQLTPTITGLSLTPGSEAINANWDDYSGADGYKLYISTTNDINTATGVYAGATSAFNITDLNTGTLYYVWVVAYDGTLYSPYATSSATTL